MRKIIIIGNNNKNKPVNDGGRLKVRLYYKLLKEHYNDVHLIDLSGWIFRFFPIIRKIKKVVKEKPLILIMGGPKGSRFIIPLVNSLNKKHFAKTIFCPLGTGVFEKIMKGLTSEQSNNFIKTVDFYGIRDEKMRINLQKLDLIIPQNEILVDLYKKFYSLNNVMLLRNFRLDSPRFDRKYVPNKTLSLVFLSRVCEEKGIIDLLLVINELIKDGYDISLDIYGPIDLSDDLFNQFNSLLNASIRYKGVIDSLDSIDTLTHYDLFVLPTKYIGEGTPAALLEAKFAGTPSLISSYSQSSLLVSPGFNGEIFEINNKNSMKEKILKFYERRDLISKFGINCLEDAKKYSFVSNKDVFYGIFDKL